MRIRDGRRLSAVGAFLVAVFLPLIVAAPATAKSGSAGAGSTSVSPYSLPAPDPSWDLSKEVFGSCGLAELVANLNGNGYVTAALNLYSNSGAILGGDVWVTSWTQTNGTKIQGEWNPVGPGGVWGSTYMKMRFLPGQYLTLQGHGYHYVPGAYCSVAIQLGPFKVK